MLVLYSLFVKNLDENMSDREPCDDSKVVEEELRRLRIPGEDSTQVQKEALKGESAEDLCDILNRCLVTTCRTRSTTSNSLLKNSNTFFPPSKKLKHTCKPLIQRSRLQKSKRLRYLRKPKLNYVKFNHINDCHDLRDQMEETVTKNPNTPIIQSTCSQQALNPCPNDDDTTIEELAAYFDCLVYIPKKMSQMAEMMYT